MQLVIQGHAPINVNNLAPNDVPPHTDATQLTLTPFPGDDLAASFAEAAKDFISGSNDAIAGRIAEVNLDAIILRVDGAYIVLLNQKDLPVHRVDPMDKIRELMKEATMPLSSPAVKFDLFDVPAPVAEELPIESDRCSKCHQKRCRVHGKRFQRF